MQHSTIVKITSDTTDRFQTGEVGNKNMRRYLIKCISAVYNHRGVKDKPTQAKISKNLKKIKNTEVCEYFNRGCIMINVNEDGEESNYVYYG